MNDDSTERGAANARDATLLLREAACLIYTRSNVSSLAQKAGLQEGDVITSLAGEPVEGVDVLHRLLGEDRIGIATRLIVLRGAKRLEISLIPEMRPQ